MNLLNLFGLTWDVNKSSPAGSPPVVMGWPTPPPGMGPCLGLPNRASTGGWGIVGTAGATARRLGGCVGRVVGKRPSYAQGFGAPPLVGWSGRGMATLGEPALAYERAVTKVPGRSGA